MQDCIRKKVSVCIVLRDALTNEIIEASDIQVLVNDRLSDLQKERKYYIFQNLHEKHVEVRIVSQFYEEMVYTAELEQPGGEKPIMISQDCLLSRISGIPLLSISLYPGRQYSFPAGCRRIECTETPGGMVSIIRNQKYYSLLVEDYQGGDIMHILLPDHINEEGLHLRIADKAGGQHEDFVVLQEQEHNCYLIDHALSGRYERGSKLYELYCGKAGADGRAVLFVVD